VGSVATAARPSPMLMRPVAVLANAASPNVQQDTLTVTAALTLVAR
jgi:hypothetical protein